MTRLTNRLEADLREIADRADPSPSAWESILARLDDEAASEVELVPVRSPGRPRRPLWLAAAAAALVLITGSIAVLIRVGDDESISTADGDPATVDFPALTATFVSPRNGFSVRYLDRGEGTVTPATQLWGFSERVDGEFDVVETGLAAVFKGASTEFTIVPGLTIGERIDEYLSVDDLPGACGVPRSQQAEIIIDGLSGRVVECPNTIEATVVAGGRLYVFALSHDRADARAVFDAFVDTIELTPETAVDLPPLSTTFVSPTYGYSFGFFDRGGPEPAGGRWDPTDDQVDTIQFDDRFDAVETGLAAYFVGASTAIPDGVSIDGWYDEHVSSSGCGVPRSQQAGITIDGRPGRTIQCGNQIETTVVAGERLYLFILGADRDDRRALFDSWVATIELTPDTAAP